MSTPTPQDIEERFKLAPRAEPWSTALGNIPWNDPGFSRRMLVEHLNQMHEGASRSYAAIDRQVEWIHEQILDGQPTRILDLGCGPGLYTERFARLGHTCVGLDMGPASVEYARAAAASQQLDCRYELGDLRSLPYGEGFGLVFFSFGEPSVFSREQLASIIERCCACIMPGGALLLEPHTPAGVEAIGDAGTSTKNNESGLFLDRHHLLRTESSYDPDRGIGVRRYLVYETSELPIDVHTIWYQSYSDDELRALLSKSGFHGDSVAFHPNLVDEHQPAHLQFVSAHSP